MVLDVVQTFLFIKTFVIKKRSALLLVGKLADVPRGHNVLNKQLGIFEQKSEPA